MVRNGDTVEAHQVSSLHPAECRSFSRGANATTLSFALPYSHSLLCLAANLN